MLVRSVTQIYLVLLCSGIAPSLPVSAKDDICIAQESFNVLCKAGDGLDQHGRPKYTGWMYIQRTDNIYRFVHYYDTATMRAVMNGSSKSLILQRIDRFYSPGFAGMPDSTVTIGKDTVRCATSGSLQNRYNFPYGGISPYSSGSYSGKTQCSLDPALRLRGGGYEGEPPSVKELGYEVTIECDSGAATAKGVWGAAATSSSDPIITKIRYIRKFFRILCSQTPVTR